jgi:large subunit ribosomal protein L13
MDMNRSFFIKTSQRNPQWRLIDAKGQTLGRLATKLADALRGKDKPTYTPHNDAGDYVVVINAEQIVLTGKKWTDKIYVTHSGWMGGKKETSARDLMAKHPTRILELAVKRMLPKNKLANALFRKLKVYAGSEHPHAAQIK